MTALPSADIVEDGSGLRSQHFDDIYFQPEAGLEESNHVFLNGNHLADRFGRLTPGEAFVIAELGFGTGLNALAAIDLFQRMAPAGAHLHFWSVEGFPLSQARMDEALSKIGDRFAQIADLAETLREAYPPSRPGLWQCRLTPRATLTVTFDTVDKALAEAPIKADAWFLDGFSPAKNPDMWSPTVLAMVAAKTKAGGTLATFTVAGAVRRALAETGLDVEKAPGFGKKRDMLRASKPQGSTTPPAPIRNIAILGAGIAGAALAWHAQRLGLSPTLYDPSGPAHGASGNPMGLLMPRIEAADSPSARLYRDAFLYAVQFYQEATPNALTLCGGTLKAGEDQHTRHEKVMASGLWTDGDLHLTDQGDLRVPGGATLQVAEAVKTLINNVPLIRAAPDRLEVNDDNVILSVGDTQQRFDAVFVASGPQSAALAQLGDDLRASRGQMDVFDGPAIGDVMTEGSYIAPMDQQLAAGATYDDVPLDHIAKANMESTDRNRKAAEGLLKDRVGAPALSRASVRAVTLDRHPIAGPAMPSRLQKEDGLARLWILTGLGSRGLSTGPLLAAHLLAGLSDGVSPLSPPMAKVVDPGRFAARRARRGQG